MLGKRGIMSHLLCITWALSMSPLLCQNHVVRMISYVMHNANLLHVLRYGGFQSVYVLCTPPFLARGCRAVLAAIFGAPCRRAGQADQCG